MSALRDLVRENIDYNEQVSGLRSISFHKHWRDVLIESYENQVFQKTIKFPLFLNIKVYF
jgi:hypothetical protein